VNVKDFAKEVMDRTKKSMDELSLEKIESIVNILINAYNKDNQIILFGNGGSASTASHFASDLTKGTVVADKKRFRAICLNDNISAITAWSNDSSYDDVFREQLVNFLRPGDVVIGISGSGNSQNVLNAMQYANEHGAVTIGLTGYDGGKLKELAKECIVVSGNDMEIAETVHLFLEHVIKLYLKEWIEKSA
jgi:D-sedoheptulose 7-phosphate isomerase